LRRRLPDVNVNGALLHEDVVAEPALLLSTTTQTDLKGTVSRDFRWGNSVCGVS
jgi:hypothetical protein